MKLLPVCSEPDEDLVLQVYRNARGCVLARGEEEGAVNQRIPGYITIVSFLGERNIVHLSKMFIMQLQRTQGTRFILLVA